MSDDRSVQLDDEAVDELLGRGGTGVISFARGSDEPPHSVPVSYGYDAGERALFFRLAVGAESEKEGVARDGAPVSFVTYSQTDAGWRSVVARGRLEALTDETVDASLLDSMEHVDIPIVDVFETSPRKLTFRFFRLADAEVTGRREATGDV